MNRRIAFIALVSLLAIAALFAVACASGARDTNQDGLRDDETGRYSYVSQFGGDSPVGAIPDVPMRDAQRNNKEYLISVEYPTRGTNHPLVIFSPGFGGSNRSYVGLSSYWASNGYVVIRTAHSDSTRDAKSAAEVWENQTPADWQNRVRDVTFVLDQLESLEQRYPELAGKIDRTRIGVGGHSYGAYTAMLLGGVKTFPGGTSYADPRVKAIVLMSPQGPGAVRGLTAESYSTLRIPVLFLTGTRDAGVAAEETPEWRREAYTLSPAGDKWLAVLRGARHASFTGRTEDLLAAIAREQAQSSREPLPPNPAPDPSTTNRDPYNPNTPTQMEGRRTRSEGLAIRERDIFNVAKSMSLAFWDTYLRGEAKGREALAQEWRGATVESK